MHPSADNKAKIKKLKQYIALCVEYDCINESYQQLLHKLNYPAPTIQVLSDMPINHTVSNTIQSNYILLQTLLDTLNHRQQKIIAVRAEIENSIMSLSDATHRNILILRYLTGLSWEKICIRINYEWAQVHRLHSSALQKINI